MKKSQKSRKKQPRAHPEQPEKSVKYVTVVIVFEHFSHRLLFLPVKLLSYLVGFWTLFLRNNKKAKQLPAPYFIVLRTGKKPLKSKTFLRNLIAMVPGINAESILNFDCDIVDLPSIAFEKIVGGPTLQVVMSVLKKVSEGHEEEFGEALAAAEKIKDDEVCTELLVKVLDFVAKGFASRRKKLDSDQVSTSLHTVFKGREKKMMPTIFDELRAEGEIRGEARGRAEGQSKSILHVLKTRFHSSPATIEKKLSKITNLEQLTVLLERAVYCDSLKSFAASLK